MLLVFEGFLVQDLVHLVLIKLLFNLAESLIFWVERPLVPPLLLLPRLVVAMGL